MNIFKDKIFGNGSNYVYYQRLATDEHFKTSSLIYMKAIATTNNYNKIIKDLDLNIVGSLKA